MNPNQTEDLLDDFDDIEPEEPKYLISNNFLTRPIWTGVKFSLVFFAIPLFWAGLEVFFSPTGFWGSYSFFIVLFYAKEIIALTLTLCGYSHLVDNRMAHVPVVFSPAPLPTTPPIIIINS